MQVDRLLTEALDQILETRTIECVFQPIVILQTGETIGFEALARWPTDTGDSGQDALFAYAEQVGKLPELDWICRAAACRAALAGKFPRDLLLFVNVEPASARTRCPADLVDVIRAAGERLQVVAELTERSVARDPAGLLAAVAELRDYHSRIALDDVGAASSSQAMMSLLRPEVIKLDRRITHAPTTPAGASVVSAVLAEAERTGAVILAEGVETPGQADMARSIGATLGQGWLFGHPGPLPERFTPSSTVLPHNTVPLSEGATPFDVARRHRQVNHASKSTMLALSRYLEANRVITTEPAVLLATFQHIRYFDDRTRRQYADLASKGIFTATYASGMPTNPGPNIRGCALADDDPLVGEWDVVVIGSHFAGGLFGRERPTNGGERDRQFDVVVSYDRDLILAAARPLLQRLLPAPR